MCIGGGGEGGATKTCAWLDLDCEQNSDALVTHRKKKGKKYYWKKGEMAGGGGGWGINKYIL